MKILFLYTEVAGYFLSCAERLHQITGAEVHIVRWPVNKEAPFQFRSYEGVTFYERDTLDTDGILALFRQLSPAAVCITGWMDKGYVSVAKNIYKTGTPVVCLLDNQWRGDFRQQLAALVSPWYLHKRFSHVWVAGQFQYEFARRLGFAPGNILMHVYSAATEPFQAVSAKRGPLPHNLLYVGRFVETKGIQELYQAFEEVSREMEHDWTLTLVGTGPLLQHFQASERVKITGFVQPDQLPALAALAGCFVLPSRYEPWGVVLHEFAAAGLPLIASDACGSATAFIRHGYNGFIFPGANTAELKRVLRQLFSLSDIELTTFGQRSQSLSYAINPDIWASTLLSIIRQP